ncbi:hypothetical protein GVN99_04860 [Serratia marcescens]|uniref:Fic family protein n=1 Tax=Serratia TaxID=613 RepID=UPI0015727A2D|nr:Fic family protein [Serratia marcescens]MBI6132237.1 Fic family protein [Serratia marcescens]NSM18455.1 hypothetical protein [Serratia marcescens]NSM46967.1 hypothetical protein [Serratia marcescens]
MEADMFNIKLEHFIPPKLNDLLPSTREKLRASESSFFSYHADIDKSYAVKNALANIPSECLVKLKYRLSENYMARQIDRKTPKRTSDEVKLISNFSMSYKEIIIHGDFNAFLAFLINWSGVINNRNIGVRNVPMKSSSDSEGCYVKYIEHEHLADGMRKVWGIMVNAPYHCLFSAVVSSVMLLAYHPFIDGNGRFSRLLMNAMLSRDKESYIPFYDVYHQSQGGYFIRLRQAQLFLEWDGIIVFHSHILDFLTSGYSKIATNNGRVKP